MLGPALILIDWSFEKNKVNPFFGSPFFVFIRITNDCIGRAMIPVMTVFYLRQMIVNMSDAVFLCAVNRSFGSL